MLEQVDILEVKLKLDHAQCTLVNTPLSARAHLERITKDYRSTNEISHGRFCKCLHLFFSLYNRIFLAEKSVHET